MKDLIARLEKATEPDRELLLDCYEAAFNDRRDLGPKHLAQFLRLLDAEAWTDAALTLVPDEHTWEVWREWGGPLSGKPGFRFEAETWAKSHCNVLKGEHKTSPAIAICIAALKARSIA